MIQSNRCVSRALLLALAAKVRGKMKCSTSRLQALPLILPVLLRDAKWTALVANQCTPYGMHWNDLRLKHGITVHLPSSANS